MSAPEDEFLCAAIRYSGTAFEEVRIEMSQ